MPEEGNYGPPALIPNPFKGAPSTNNWDFYQAQEQCGGYWDDFTGSAYNWYSSNTAVATLASSLLHTVGVGAATGRADNLLQATHPAPRCPQAVMQGMQPVTVQTPTSLKVLGVTVLPDGSGPPNGCPGTLNYGIKVDIKYQVLDQAGQPIQSATMTPYETVTFFTGGQGQGNMGPVPGYPTSKA